MRPPRRGRRLTAGEARLWDAIAKLVTPLPGRATPVPEAAPEMPTPTATMPALTAPILKPTAAPVAKKPRAKKLPPKPAPEPPRPATAAPYQAPPQRNAPSAGLERTAKVGLRRGRLAIEARIDLHGMVQAEAHAALTGFLLRARAAGHAYVLVVTGKGGPGYSEAFAERGVLRRSVPHWLRGGELRGIVLGFEEAARHHGGAGALYVRLRRR
ncbi:MULTISPECIES: Smr/MutS family protein [unclassified Methylobacterium]|jgi:DNA-nicking Smr family endonuclease|uniref:Smr/MutS family protein n=1 Tax=unclassified Methylobacterium TaxID=2615210 RepID=UPI00135589ED|nr:Smr/MutS family protein [Methylobacterium sp. 2A]MWV23794.1 DNA mismatch repair protein MutS [Methylobacterium sp. 2A]